eukprot:CAMPEP_0196690334 /NCGR_PEP_ID=MMETSP1090-20130531/19841_1 /TAXON_ID=37098 /ORGANISM="Isochrysis sp, Strain CCMP1244" /LENGTH=125 /DNA_ID=CAMNT_0042029429 /DNA_START=209 /DNA_END=586 /DNA_ORIENTATION=-
MTPASWALGYGIQRGEVQLRRRVPLHAPRLRMREEDTAVRGGVLSPAVLEPACRPLDGVHDNLGIGREDPLARGGDGVSGGDADASLHLHHQRERHGEGALHAREAQRLHEVVLRLRLVPAVEMS